MHHPSTCDLCHAHGDAVRVLPLPLRDVVLQLEDIAMRPGDSRCADADGVIVADAAPSAGRSA